MNRDRWIRISLSEEELQMLKALSERKGWNMSQWIRQVIREANESVQG